MSTLQSKNGSRRRTRKQVVARADSAPRVVPSIYFRYKRWLDLALASVLLVPALPIIGLLVLLIRGTSHGPGIFRQRRVGLHGREFYLYKLRSMRVDAEAASGPVWATVKDPRTTRLGRILRTLHLDELPQLFNVLKGEMSLVGPRPERPEFVRVLRTKISDYDARLAVLPGITGLAQVNLPPDTDLASVRRKQSLDVMYVEQAGLWLDLRLLLATSTRLVKVSSVRLLGLRRAVPKFDEPTPSAGHDALSSLVAVGSRSPETPYHVAVGQNVSASGGAAAPQHSNHVSERSLPR